jgi:hypothetical protein
MENTFATWEECKLFMQGHSISLKFKFRTEGYDSRRRQEAFICHCVRSYTRKSSVIWKNTSTIMTGCPYKLVLQQNQINNMLWSSTVTNNHSHSLDCHAKIPFTTEELQALAQSKNARIAPCQELAQILNQNPNCNVGSKDVYNANL